MWLEVAATNNNPAVVAKYYAECVRHIGGKQMILAHCLTKNYYKLFLKLWVSLNLFIRFS